MARCKTRNVSFAGIRRGDLIEFMVGKGKQIGTSLARVLRVADRNLVIQDIGHYGQQMYIHHNADNDPVVNNLGTCRWGDAPPVDDKYSRPYEMPVAG